MLPPNVKLRPYQRDVVEHAAAATNKFTLYASPTGTGKGTMELAIHGDDSAIVTPSLQIGRGFLERLGVDTSKMSTNKLAAACAERRIYTPQRFLNALPDVNTVIVDEVHHAVRSGKRSAAMFAAYEHARWFGFTATPFRGTVAGTIALKEQWGEPLVVLTIPEAIGGGWWALPDCEVVPLVDDELISITNGEFAIEETSHAVETRLGDVVDWVQEHRGFAPTAVIVPSSGVAKEIVKKIPNAHWVGQATKERDRAAAYAACRDEGAVLVSVAILTEGVDFPWLGQIVDLRPTNSPVAWLQLFGRLTRPKPYTPRYVCMCRNIERHGYLLTGAVPGDKLAELAEQFPEGTRGRSFVAGALRPFSRFRPSKVPLASGQEALLYSLYKVDRKGNKKEWVVLSHPYSEEYLVATRINRARWTECPPPELLDGYASTRWPSPFTVKQATQWEKNAERHGLSPNWQGLQSHHYAALAVLRDVRKALA